MYKIDYNGLIVDDYETISEAEENLKQMIENDITENLSIYTDRKFDIDKFKNCYAIYKDEEFEGYDVDFIDFDDLEEKYKGDWRKSEKYYQMLKNDEFSEEMIKDVLYSINKKAKNYRDEIRALSGNNQFRYQYNIAKSNKNQMYRYKEKIIEKFPIIEIHKNNTDNFIYLEDEEIPIINTTYFGVVNVYGYKVHTLIDEEKFNTLVNKGIDIKDTEFIIDGENDDNLLNDRLIDFFIEKWDLKEKNKILIKQEKEELER